MNLAAKVRECGGCMVCCEIGEVKELDKPPNTPCQHQDNGCAIYGKLERPSTCDEFFCAWARGFGEEPDRPDKCGVMVSINQGNGGVWIFVMDYEKDAHRMRGQRIIFEVAEKFHLPVIVANGNNLGGMGDYVLLKGVLKPRASRLMGAFIETIGELDKYELVIENAC
jgi:hypothetical protein